MQAIISSFFGPFRFLSNYYMDMPPIVYEGIAFPTVEHAYQAAKVCDDEVRRAFAMLRHPDTAKRIGHSVPLRPDWKEVKASVMRELLALKFAAGSPLAQSLCDTLPCILVEGNYWHDNFWGQCTCERCDKELQIVGHNWLGHLLMERRKDLTDCGGTHTQKS